MSNLFEQKLAASPDTVIKSRAARYAATAAMAQVAIITALQKTVFDCENKLEDISDIAPTSKDSMVVGDKSYPADVWATNYHLAAIRLRDAKRELAIAESTQAKWFGTPSVPTDAAGS